MSTSQCSFVEYNSLNVSSTKLTFELSKARSGLEVDHMAGCLSTTKVEAGAEADHHRPITMTETIRSLLILIQISDLRVSSKTIRTTTVPHLHSNLAIIPGGRPHQARVSSLEAALPNLLLVAPATVMVRLKDSNTLISSTPGRTVNTSQGTVMVTMTIGPEMTIGTETRTEVQEEDGMRAVDLILIIIRITPDTGNTPICAHRRRRMHASTCLENELSNCLDWAQAAWWRNSSMYISGLDPSAGQYFPMLAIREAEQSSI
jgi:hypothetical protein